MNPFKYLPSINKSVFPYSMPKIYLSVLNDITVQFVHFNLNTNMCIYVIFANYLIYHENEHKPSSLLVHIQIGLQLD